MLLFRMRVVWAPHIGAVSLDLLPFLFLYPFIKSLLLLLLSVWRSRWRSSCAVLDEIYIQDPSSSKLILVCGVRCNVVTLCFCLNALFARIRNHETKILCAATASLRSIRKMKNKRRKQPQHQKQQQQQKDENAAFSPWFWLWKFLFAHRRRARVCVRGCGGVGLHVSKPHGHTPYATQ